MLSRESSPDDGLFGEESPVAPRNPAVPRQPESTANYASSQNSQTPAPVADYLNGKCASILA